METGGYQSDGQVLEAYRKDRQEVERSFRFLKDPWFMAPTLFLKPLRRIMALMAVMILCLMVYAALEHRRLGSHRVPLALLGERHVAVYSNSG